MHEITENLSISSPEIECQSIESALALVKRSIGVTLVPSYIAKYGTSEQNDALRFISLSDSVLESDRIGKRHVCLFYRKEQFLTDAEKDFISCVTEITKA